MFSTMSAARILGLAVLLFALASTGTWIALHSSQSAETRCLDAEMYYFPIARSLWEGRGLLQDDGTFCTHQPPAYAAVLVLPLAAARATGVSEVAAARVVNLIWATLAGLGLAMLLLPRVGRCVAAVAAVVAVCLPQFLWLCRNGYNEPMFTALLLWALVLAVRGTERASMRWLAWAAVLFALATLTRSIGLLIPPIVAVAGWLTAKERRKVGLRWLGALAIYALALAPWVAVVSAKVGKFTPVSTSFLPSHIDGLVSSNSPEVAARAKAHFRTEGRTSEAVRAFHRAEWERSPGDFIRFWLTKPLHSTYASESKRGQAVLGFITIPLLLVGAAAAGWLAWHGAWPRPELLVAVALFAYFFGMAALVWSTVRYLVPVLWIPVALAAWAWAARKGAPSPINAR